MNQIKLFGKPIRVNMASSDKRQLDVGANLFVGGLDWNVDERQLWDAFSQLGTLVAAPQISRDPATGESKGYGFVSYERYAKSAMIGADAAQLRGGRCCDRGAGRTVRGGVCFRSHAADTWARRQCTWATPSRRAASPANGTGRRPSVFWLRKLKSTTQWSVALLRTALTSQGPSATVQYTAPVIPQPLISYGPGGVPMATPLQQPRSYADQYGAPGYSGPVAGLIGGAPPPGY